MNIDNQSANQIEHILHMHLSHSNWSDLSSYNLSLFYLPYMHNVQAAACFQLFKSLIYFFHKTLLFPHLFFFRILSQVLFVIALLFCMDIHSQWLQCQADGDLSEKQLLSELEANLCPAEARN